MIDGSGAGNPFRSMLVTAAIEGRRVDRGNAEVPRRPAGIAVVGDGTVTVTVGSFDPERLEDAFTASRRQVLSGCVPTLRAMTLHFAGALDRSAVFRAAELVADLVGRPEVATGWDDESSCAGMSVGGLTWHLVNQPVSIARLVPSDGSAPAGTETIDLLEHYARAAWVREDHDGEANRSIRDAANTGGSGGPDVAIAALSDARAELQSVLAEPPATTYIPWQGWALATDDFLVTRLMEMVVHADDLAVSVQVPTPDFGLAVLDPVFRLLTAIAVRRHGQDSLVRALTRPQRAPATVSAF